MVIIWLNGLFLLVLLRGGIFKANRASKGRYIIVNRCQSSLGVKIYIYERATGSFCSQSHEYAKLHSV